MSRRLAPHELMRIAQQFVQYRRSIRLGCTPCVCPVRHGRSAPRRCQRRRTYQRYGALSARDPLMGSAKRKAAAAGERWQASRSSRATQEAVGPRPPARGATTEAG